MEEERERRGRREERLGREENEEGEEAWHPWASPGVLLIGQEKQEVAMGAPGASTQQLCNATKKTKTYLQEAPLALGFFGKL
jgi:hypothetical protein